MFDVFSHHKCGTVAVLDYLNEFAKLNDLKFYHTHRGDDIPHPDSQISFLSNAHYPVLAGYTNRTSIHLIRNPLDIVQSAYYSHRFSHSLEGWPKLEEQRRKLVSADKEEGMMLTALYCMDPEFYEKTPGPLYGIKHWNFDDHRFLNARVEDFFDRLTDAFRQKLSPIFDEAVWPDQTKFTFANYSRSTEGSDKEKVSHFRSGKQKAWKDELPACVIQYVRSELGEVLARFYPEDA